MIKGLIKLGVYFTGLAILINYVSPELGHSFLSSLGNAGNDILSGVKTEISNYIKEKAVEGVKDLPSAFWNDLTSTQNPFDKNAWGK